MKIRTQLLLAFLLLAVLPLAGIVLYSYWSSQRTFRQAVEVEFMALAAEMSDRLEEVRRDLAVQVEGLATLPVWSLLSAEAAGEGSGWSLFSDDEATLDAGEVYVKLMEQMGETADQVDWLELRPAAPAPPAPPATPDPAAPDPTAPAPPAVAATATADTGPATLQVEAELAAEEALYIYPSRALADALKRLRLRSERLAESGLDDDFLRETLGQAIRTRRLVPELELEALDARGEQVRKVLGASVTTPVRRAGQIVGSLTVQMPPDQILEAVLARTPRDRNEIPYAREADGTVFVERAADQEQLTQIGLGAGGSAPTHPDWIVVETEDPGTGLTFGVARPVAEPLRAFRLTAARNFGYGLAMVALAAAGVAWISKRMTRKLGVLTAGAERLAAGDLEARVPVEGKDEFGALASTMNRMAAELAENQQRLLEEERRRREQEIRQRLLEAEHQRKTAELEDARRLQLALLPKELPRLAKFELATFMRTAAEVGGDYYDFFPGANGELVAALGDAAGHGARAGTMVTVVKGLLTAGAAAGEPAAVLAAANRAIKRMRLERMNMALTLVRIDGARVRMSSAGMPPGLLHREDGTIEEIGLVGPPLGGMDDPAYQEWSAELAPGEVLLLMSDGLPELLDERGEPLGYPAARELFARAAGRAPHDLVNELAAAAAARKQGAPPDDDVSFLVLRRR